jgi:hypothetical protein
MKFKENDWIYYQNTYYKIKYIGQSFYYFYNGESIFINHPNIREAIKVNDNTQIILLELQH